MGRVITINEDNLRTYINEEVMASVADTIARDLKKSDRYIPGTSRGMTASYKDVEMANGEVHHMFFIADMEIREKDSVLIFEEIQLYQGDTPNDIINKLLDIRTEKEDVISLDANDEITYPKKKE